MPNDNFAFLDNFQKVLTKANELNGKGFKESAAMFIYDVISYMQEATPGYNVSVKFIIDNLAPVIIHDFHAGYLWPAILGCYNILSFKDIGLLVQILIDSEFFSRRSEDNLELFAEQDKIASLAATFQQYEDTEFKKLLLQRIEKNVRKSISSSSEVGH